ncbi:hypothetical protein C2I18_20800 [Paenibacillus sp. PK3_47]|uniref:hypothetical protein n=1 Tax=Paenibacillus sp. PK3_47 TaxID=2072642 RepID=UPI00201E5439|nr:hypothetical protein [Paenibacillus sp. PK3_47]UQZ35750.1 hypothetical protein C2I18_20800 [Paenibacillus sp. PK3_47]
MTKSGNPANGADGSDDPLYPLVFRISRWHYFIAVITVATSIFFIMLGYSRSGFSSIMLWTVGGLLGAVSLYYTALVTNSFVELDQDKMRYRNILRTLELDVNQIYAEKINGAFLVHSPDQPVLTISGYYKDATLLHSLLFKHSEQNIERLSEAAPHPIVDFSSLTGSSPVTASSWARRRLNYAVVFLLFVAAISIAL